MRDIAAARILGSSAGCEGASVFDFIGPPSGEIRHHHQFVCLQHWLSPLTVRPLRSHGGWEVLRPRMRLWRPEEPQFFQWQGAVHQRFVLVARDRVESVLERPYASCGVDRWGGRDFEDRMVTQLVEAMAMDCVEGSPAGPLLVDSLITALVARLAAATPPSSPRNRLAPARLQRVLDFIESEMHRPLGLADLAAQAGVGVRQFCTAFRNAVGTSPHQYLLQRRVERAKELLGTSMLGLAEIAAAVGFCDQSQLTRTFTRIAGVTPGRYRGGSPTRGLPDERPRP